MFCKYSKKFIIFLAMFFFGFVSGVFLLFLYFPVGFFSWHSEGIANIQKLFSVVIASLALVYTAKSASAAASSALSAKESVDKWQDRELYLKTVEHAVRAKGYLLYLSSSLSTVYSKSFNFETIHIDNFVKEKRSFIDNFVPITEEQLISLSVSHFLYSLKIHCEEVSKIKIEVQESLMSTILLFESRINQIDTNDSFPFANGTLKETMIGFLSFINEFTYVYENISTEKVFPLYLNKRNEYYKQWLFINGKVPSDVELNLKLLTLFDAILTDLISSSDLEQWNNTNNVLENYP